MSRICVNVLDGATLITNKGARIALAGVVAPPPNTPEGQMAKDLLQSLVLGRFITYDTLALRADARAHRVQALAEVWLDDKSVNDSMRAAGFREASGQMQLSSVGPKREGQAATARLLSRL